MQFSFICCFICNSVLCTALYAQVTVLVLGTAVAQHITCPGPVACEARLANSTGWGDPVSKTRFDSVFNARSTK